MATGAYPFLARMKPQDFARLLGMGVSLLLSDVVDRASA
jgi:hypothetical protein